MYQRCVILAFLPESNYGYILILAGLLACSVSTPSHLLTVASMLKLFDELTAAGTAPDFNRIPF